MRNIKPFSFIYRNWNVRATNIQNFKNRLNSNVYKCNLTLKKEDQKFTIPVKEINAKDKKDLELQLRLILNQLNY